MNPTKIKHALLKEGISIPGTNIAGDLTLSDKKHPGLKMILTVFGLEVLYKEQRIVIPAHNLRFMAIDNESK